MSRAAVGPRPLPVLPAAGVVLFTFVLFWGVRGTTDNLGAGGYYDLEVGLPWTVGGLGGVLGMLALAWGTFQARPRLAAAGRIGLAVAAIPVAVVGAWIGPQGIDAEFVRTVNLGLAAALLLLAAFARPVRLDPARSR